jgi:hypothetical protein
VDTVQIINRCGAGTSAELLSDPLCVGFVEIWDVRVLALQELRQWRLGTPGGEGALKALGIGSPLWGLRGGGGCELSVGWESCLSCTGSASERACRFRCRKDDRRSPWRFEPLNETEPNANRTFRDYHGTIKIPHVPSGLQPSGSRARSRLREHNHLTDLTPAWPGGSQV